MAKPITPRVLEWRPIRQGNLRGLFTVQIGPLEIRKIRLVQQPGQAPWVSPPQEAFERGGRRQWTTLVVWPPEWGKAILDAALEAQRDFPEGITQQASATAFRQEVRQRAGIGGRN